MSSYSRGVLRSGNDAPDLLAISDLLLAARQTILKIIAKAGEQMFSYFMGPKGFKASGYF